MIFHIPYQILHKQLFLKCQSCYYAEIENKIFRNCYSKILFFEIGKHYLDDFWTQLLFLLFRAALEIPKSCSLIRSLSKILCTRKILPYKVKAQYVHLKSIADTSIKGTISLQSTPMLKSCIYMFENVDTAFR